MVGKRRDQQELDDPWLGQGDIGPDLLPRPPGSPAREGGCLNGHASCSLRRRLARDQAAAPGTLGPSVAAPPPHRLAHAEPPAQCPGPGPDRPHRRHGRRRPPDGVGPRLQQLARVLGGPPDPGGAVPRPDRVRQSPGHGRHHRCRRRGLPRLDLPHPPPAGPDLAQRRARGRRAGPGRPWRDRRVHQVEPLRRHGALLRVHAPSGRRRGAGAPLQPRLHAGLGPPPGAPTPHPALLRPPRPARARHRRRHRHHRIGSPRRRRLGSASGQADTRSRCATWRNSTRAWPSC